MKTFEKLAQIHDDHELSWNAFRTAIANCRDVSGEISRRISEAQQRNAAWVAELEEASEDPTRTETARRMSALEAERMKGQAFKPTADELELYRQELENAQTALKDVRQLRADFEAAHKAADGRLAELRKAVLGNGGWVAADNWLASAQTTYERLSGEVGHNV